MAAKKPAHSLQLETSYVPAAQADATSGLLQITVSANAKLPVRLPVNLCCVVDCSNGLEGERLALLKEVVLFAGYLSEYDHFAMVTFGSNFDGHHVLKATRMTAAAKDDAWEQIEHCDRRGATPLASAVHIGLQQLHRAKADTAALNCMVLFTDSTNSDGVADAENYVFEIIQAHLRRGASANREWVVHTFGTGAKCEVSFLRRIAEAGNGQFCFIRNIDDVQFAILTLIGGVVELANINAQLHIKLANGGPGKPGGVVKDIQAGHAVETVAEGAEYIVSLGHLYAEERRDIVCFLDKYPGNTATVQLRYTAVNEAFQPVAQQIEAIVVKPLVAAKQAGAAAVEQVVRLRMGRLLQDAADQLIKGNVDAVIALLTKTVASADGSRSVAAAESRGLSVVDDVKYCLKLVEKYKASPSDLKLNVYPLLYSISEAHMKQRGSYISGAMYKTTNQKRTVEAAVAELQEVRASLKKVGNWKGTLRKPLQQLAQQDFRSVLKQGSLEVPEELMDKLSISNRPTRPGPKGSSRP
eukprot:TRINITY_DN6317_c0_g1_i2.p1 TRINITY_DN6317_c0_g1~~TRINITY_DN6317_c0_g1_i2.p1  ORF type:complete len:527 (+),score=218.37 TRINITY_DN6317_c0_g1_i2:940-2520(+)